MGYLRHVRACNNFNKRDKTTWIIDNKRVGYVRDDMLSYVLKSGIFCKNGDNLELISTLNNFDSRTEALDKFSQKAFDDGITNIFMNEPYGVRNSPSSEPLCLVDRSVSTLLGIISFGQHMNGYVNTDDGLKMWIARRSNTKGYYPRKLDHIVAGGLYHGISEEENLQKECYEEAGIEKELASKAKSVGLVSYHHEYRLGGSEDIIYCYDLELPTDFVPRCTDGEVEEFYLMSIEEVMDLVKNSDEFKLNCNLVITDFLIRHGYLSAKDKDYVEIISELRS